MYPEQVKRDKLREALETLGLAEGWDDIQGIHITPEKITITRFDRSAPRVPTPIGMATTTYLIRIA